MSHVKTPQAVAGDHEPLLAAASQSWDRRIFGPESFLPPGQEIPKPRQLRTVNCFAKASFHAQGIFVPLCPRTLQFHAYMISHQDMQGALSL